MRFIGYGIGLLLVGVFALGTPATAAQKPFVTYDHPALEAISEAYAADQISKAEAMLYRFYFVMAPERLPAQFSIPGPPIKSGTPILTEVLTQLDQLTPLMRGEVAGMRLRPSLPNTRTSAHYVIHYDGASTTEEYIDVIEGAAEAAWAKYHTDMTWNVPPGDGSIGGGTDLTDCYVHSLGSGILGMAQPESFVPGGASNDATGYFHVNTTISDEPLRCVTTAHEYMHVTQFGYLYVSGITWWMENCAMMGEEWTYDVYNEYLPYLPPFFTYPYWSLDTFGGSYEYAQITWPMYLSERFVLETVEEIWEEQMWSFSGNFWTAINTVLAPYGYGSNSAYLEFMRWCFYTGSRDDGNHLSEAGDFGMVYNVDKVVSEFPSGEKGPRPLKLPEPLGTSVIIIRPETSSSDNILEITFDGPASTLAVEFIREAADGCTEYFMTIDDNGDGYIEIPNFDTAIYVHMLTSMKRNAGSAQDFSFWAETSYDPQGLADLDSGRLVRIHPNRPNPFANRTAIEYALPNAANVQIRILDPTGRVVRHLYEGHQYAGDYEVTWNRQDDAGRGVGSGVYYALLTVAGQELARKMTVLD
ncbi:MAG: hypothetical protein KAY32_05395 [Candidatus Eisenbacteria sp.]|nr:hypothetical protein [Candidatus Eisenbacteria bacterium]